MFSQIDIKISLKDPKLVWSKSFEMNGHKPVGGQVFFYVAWMRGTPICDKSLSPPPPT